MNLLLNPCILRYLLFCHVCKQMENDANCFLLIIDQGVPKSSISGKCKTNELTFIGQAYWIISFFPSIKGAASKSSDSTQPRKNQKSPQRSKQTQAKDGIQKHIKNDKNQLSSVKPPDFEDSKQNIQENTRKGADKTQATSVKSTSISPLQESAIKRFVPAQVKMPQAYREEQRRIDNKEDRKSPMQARTLQPSLGGSQTVVTGTGRKSSAQGQEVDKASRRGSATKGTSFFLSELLTSLYLIK